MTIRLAKTAVKNLTNWSFDLGVAFSASRISRSGNCYCIPPVKQKIYLLYLVRRTHARSSREILGFE